MANAWRRRILTDDLCPFDGDVEFFDDPAPLFERARKVDASMAAGVLVLPVRNDALGGREGRSRASRKMRLNRLILLADHPTNRKLIANPLSCLE